MTARVYLSVVLDGQSTAAIGVSTEVSAGIHSALERIALPAKYVVGVLSVAGARVVMTWIKYTRIQTD